MSKADAGVTYAITSSGNDLTITNGTTNVAQTITAAAMGGAIGDTQVLNFDAVGVKFTITQDGAGAISAAQVVADLDAGADQWQATNPCCCGGQ